MPFPFVEPPSRSSWSPHTGTAPRSSSAADPGPSIVVLGGGEAGTAVLEALSRASLGADLTLVEPSEYHFDQPEWMRVGTEGLEKEETRSPKRGRVPSSVTWVQDRVTKIDGEAQTITMEEQATIPYDYLVVALGIETLWDRIRGLNDDLGTHGLCSVYGYEQAERAWAMIRAFEGGRALFTAPSTPHKGGSAPLQILRRAEALWQESSVRERTELFFAVAGPTGMSEEVYETAGDDDIHVYVGYDLVEVRPEAKEAVFRVTKGQSESRDVLPYDLLHVVPPMRPPALLEQSGLAHREGALKGYMDVEADSLRHPRFKTVFGVGDVLGIEGVKTGERARRQARTVAEALEQAITKTDDVDR